MIRLRKNIFIMIICFFFAVGCSNTGFDINSSEGKTTLSLLNRYYDNLGNPLDSNRSFSIINTTNQIAMNTAYGYLFQKGYRIIRKGEPTFVNYEKPYAIFDIDVQILYPKDANLQTLPLPITERIWVDTENFKINKIKSKDLFILSRIHNYELEQN